MNRKEKIEQGLQRVLLPLCAAAAILVMLTAVSGLDKGRSSEGRDRLEGAIRKTAVTCYASEGIYPPTLAYMEEHYGLQVDESRYTVDYSVFAENLMPEITVLEKEG